MESGKGACPMCGSSDLIFLEKKRMYFCQDCEHRFTPGKAFKPLRIFISYGHDEHASLAQRLKEDFVDRHHEVWFDMERLKPGGDWEKYIEEGIEWVASEPDTGRVVLLMTPHSIRRPDGFCHNEIARSISRGLKLVPVMVVWCEPPLSICRIQWLDMQDCIPPEKRKEQYKTRFCSLLKALEEDSLDFQGVQSRLLHVLEPLPFESEITVHLKRFTGREWILKSIDRWVAQPDSSRVFWIMGGPGVGKTALSSWLIDKRREICAFHLCAHGHTQKSDPRRVILSTSYQLSSQLPDYQKRLSAMNIEKLITGSNPRTLFDTLIIQPLSGNFPQPDRTIIILIDALDEASEGGRNELASFIASEFSRTPDWLRLIITSRQDPEVMHSLQGLSPHMLNASSKDNEDDIRAFLTRELKPYTNETEVPQSVIDLILSRSRGFFLYVEWLRRELAMGRLSLERLDEFPQGLGGIYAQFFQRQFPDTDHYKATVRPALGVISAAQEPIKLSLLMKLFKWDEYQKEEFRKSLGPLFHYTKGQVHPFHASVMNWLNDTERSCSFFVSKKAGHQQLAEYGWQEYIQCADTGRYELLSHYILGYLPRHLTESEQWKRLETILTDLRYIEAKCRQKLIYELISDYSRLGAGRAENGPPVRTAYSHEGALGIWCPFCLAWSEISPNTLVQTIGCPYCENPLKLNSFTIRAEWKPGPPKKDSGKKPKIMNTHISSSLAEYADFIRNEAHILHEYPELTFQQSYNWIDGTFPQVKAMEMRESGKETRPWLCLLNKPEKLDPCIATLMGHSRSVTSCACSPDGMLIVSSSTDGTLKIWDSESGEEITTLRGHTDVVRACTFSPDGQRIASASDDKTVKIWDASSGNELLSLEGHEDFVRACAYSPDGMRILSASEDGTLKIRDAESGAEMATFKGHALGVKGCTFSPDGRYIVSCSWDGTVKVWNGENWKEHVTLKGHSGSVEACAFSPDGRFLVSASDDTTLVVWIAERWEQSMILTGHAGVVKDCAFSPDGRSVISCSWDGTVKVWNPLSGKELITLKGHTDHVESCSCAPDGHHIVSTSHDKTLKIWNMETRGKTTHSHGHSGAIKTCAFSPDGRHVLTGSWDSTLKVWNVVSGDETAILRGHSLGVSTCTWSPDGHLVVSGSDDRTVKVWNHETGTELKTLIGHKGAITFCGFSPDGHHIITAAWDNTIKKWEVERPEEPVTMKGHSSVVKSCAFSPDRHFMVSSSMDKSLKVWDCETGKEVNTLKGHTGYVEACAYSPDGKRIVSASCDKTLKIWDSTTGMEITTLRGHSKYVKGCAFSPDGARIISMSWDNTLRIWNAETGVEIAALRGHSEYITSFTCSPDGRYIVSGSEDRTLRIWDMDAGSAIATFIARGAVCSIAMATSGSTVAAGDNGGTLYLLHLEGLESGPVLVTP